MAKAKINETMTNATKILNSTHQPLGAVAHFCLGTGVPRHSAGVWYVCTSSKARALHTAINMWHEIK